MLDLGHPAKEQSVMPERSIGETSLHVKEHEHKHLFPFPDSWIRLPASVALGGVPMAFAITTGRGGEGFFVDEARRFS
jgi:hypothetical protein